MSRPDISISSAPPRSLQATTPATTTSIVYRLRRAWWIWPLRVGGLLLSLFFLLPNIFYRPLLTGRDANWQVVLHYGAEHGWVFGKDIVFTYGPLGFLFARLAYPGHAAALLSWDIAAFLALVICLTVVYCSLKRVSEFVTCTLLCACVGMYRQPLDPSIIALFITLYFSLLLAKHLSFTAGIVAWFFASIGFYLKVEYRDNRLDGSRYSDSTAELSSQHRKWSLRVTLAGATFFAGCTYFLPVELLSYTRYSLEFIGGFAEAMHHVDPRNRHYLTMAVLLLLLCAVSICAAAISVVRSSVTQQWVEVLGLIFCGGFLFVLFKQGFIRADSHIYDFFQYAPLAVVLGYTPLSLVARRHLVAYALVTVVFCFSLLQNRFSYEYFPQKWSEVKNYFAVSQTTAQPGTVPTELTPTPRLPATVVEEIGVHSVDIITFQNYQILREGLTYRPRPVIQSYAAYTQRLDALNAAFLPPAVAPDYLLYSYTRIDDRYPFFDEAQTTRMIRAAYRPLLNQTIAQRGGYLLLRRNDQSAHPPLPSAAVAASGQVTLETPLEVPKTDSLLYLQIDLRHTFAGRLIKALYKAPPVYIELLLNNGQQIRARAIPEQLRGGVLANYAVLSVADAAQFFSGNERTLPRIVQVKLDSSWPWGVRSDADYQWRKSS